MSKRKEEKREQEYYRKKIGEKLEEAYLSIPMGEPPSEETIKKWIQIADQKRAKRLKRKRILLSSAAAVVLCVGVCATCILHTPEAVAGNSGEVKIEEGYQSKDIYTSLDDLPDDIKEEFLIFSDIPEGYSLKDATVERDDNLQTVTFNYRDVNGEQIVINEKKSIIQDEQVSIAVNLNGQKEKWQNLDVYINGFSYEENNIIYNFIHNNIQYQIKTSVEMEKSEIRNMVEKAIWG